MTKVKFRNPKITDEKREEIIKDYRGDMLVKQIVNKHKISLATVYRILREAK